MKDLEGEVWMLLERGARGLVGLALRRERRGEEGSIKGSGDDGMMCG